MSDQSKPPKPTLTVYTIHFNDGKSATMLSMAGADLEEATESAKGRFGKHRVKLVEPIQRGKGS